MISSLIYTSLFYILIGKCIDYIGDINNLIFIVSSLTYFLFLCYFDYKNNTLNKEVKPNEFVLCFRKTRVESMVMSRIEDISKTRDIQFVISGFYFKNDKSIKGSIYIITSKIVYKILFIKNQLICQENNIFNTFVSKSNIVSYNSIKNYLSRNNNCKEKLYHTEFYTWPYYYFINNYESEYKDFDSFLKSL
jgi:hypothetical protein